LCEDGSPAGDSSTATGEARRRPGANVAPDRTGPSLCYVVHDQGSGEVHFDRDTVERLLAGGDFFGSTSINRARTTFGSSETCSSFIRSRSKTRSSSTSGPSSTSTTTSFFVVVYGAARDDDRLVEVHCFYSERFLITVHRDDCPAFAEFRRRYQRREKKIEQPSLLLYRVVDGLVHSFFPVLAAFDDRIDELEDAIFCKADDEQLQGFFR
jgi:hypothetical protein